MLGEMDKTIACDIAAARAELGYEPDVELYDGHAPQHPLVRRRRASSCDARASSPAAAATSARCSSTASSIAATRSGCSTSHDADDRPRRRRVRRAATSAIAAAVARAVDGVDVVFHNVAQVPLARDPALLRTVNVDGTALLLDAAAAAGVGKVVHTSSSAVFGVPDAQPGAADHRARRRRRRTGTPSWPPSGRASTRSRDGLDVSIVRPRTILGHGRLGIFGILFDWIADGADLIVLGDGVEPLPVRPRRRPRRRVPARRRHVRARRSSTPAPTGSARCASRSMALCRARRHRARRCGRLPAAPACVGDAAPPPGSGSRRSRRTTG